MKFFLNKIKKQLRGFTLLELLLIIVITSTLAGVIVSSSLNAAARSRDSRRMQELHQISYALQLYYSIYNRYPTSADADCSIYGIDWDRSNKIDPSDEFIKPLFDENLLKTPLREWNGNTIHNKTCVYRYAKVTNPCGCTGVYAVLYASCESSSCPTNERPSCCNSPKGYPDDITPNGDDDAYDIAIFLKE